MWRPLQVLGTFHSTQNSINFGWYNVRHFSLVCPEYLGLIALKVAPFDRSGYFGRSARNVLPFDKMAVPCTALLYPALYRKNNQTCSGLDWVCVTGMFHSMARGISKISNWHFVAWKKPLILTAPEQLALLVFVRTSLRYVWYNINLNSGCPFRPASTWVPTILPKVENGQKNLLACTCKF